MNISTHMLLQDLHAGEKMCPHIVHKPAFARLYFLDQAHSEEAFLSTVCVCPGLVSKLTVTCRVVPNLLRTVLPMLPLEKVAAAKKDRSSAASQPSRAGSAAKQQAQPWRISETLKQIGGRKALASCCEQKLIVAFDKLLRN